MADMKVVKPKILQTFAGQYSGGQFRSLSAETTPSQNAPVEKPPTVGI